MGTYNGELASIAAALQTVALIRRQDVTTTVNAMGARLIHAVNGVLTDLGLAESARAVPYRWPCMPYIHFAPSGRGQALKARFFSELMRQGVLMPANHPSFVCYAHDESHIDSAVDRIRLAFEDARNDGALAAVKD